MTEMDTREISTERRDVVNVSGYCPERPYLELQVPVDSDTVQSVQFSIRSRDQGSHLEVTPLKQLCVNTIFRLV